MLLVLGGYWYYRQREASRPVIGRPPEVAVRNTPAPNDTGIAPGAKESNGAMVKETTGGGSLAHFARGRNAGICSEYIKAEQHGRKLENSGGRAKESGGQANVAPAGVRAYRESIQNGI